MRLSVAAPDEAIQQTLPAGARPGIIKLFLGGPDR
jgi:hypothetical protein